MEYSENQKAIFRAVLTTLCHILVKATAGSGKTTTLVEIAKLLPKDMNAIFVAFNKSIVEELAKKLPKGFEVSTLHSLGMNMLLRAFGSSITLNENKTYRFANDIFKGMDIDSAELNTRKYMVIQAWDYFRVTLSDIDDQEAVEEMLSKYGLPAETYIDLVPLHNSIMSYNSKSRSNGQRFDIDFTDMVYLPVVLKRVRKVRYDLVMVDECQDLNLCQHALLNIIMGRNGRMIAVGDPYQSIYGFSGADHNSFSKFTERPNTVTLPLSVSYRCASKIVEEAKKFSPEIASHPGAQEGVVDWKRLDEVRAGDFVLCRNNQPLIEAYFELIDRGEKAYILGGELGDQFIKMVKPFRNKLLSHLFSHLDDKLDQIYHDLASKGVKHPEKTDEFRYYRDNSMAIKIIARHCRTVEDLLNRIDDIFHPQKNAIVLSSIHKSKGLEADRVFLLRWDLIPSEYAVTEEERRQEKNLQFVAITRAKKELYFVPWREEENIEEEFGETGIQ